PRATSINQSLDAITISATLAKVDWVQKRNKALTTLIYATGMRISEALSIKVKDINIYQTTGYSIKITGKSNKERIIPILPALQQTLIDYIQAIPFSTFDNTPLFIGNKGKPLTPRIAQQLFKQIRITLGLDDNFTPHALRHSFATHLLN